MLNIGNRRAVSQIIAALMLIAITVAAGVMVYVFSIGLIGNLQSAGGSALNEQVMLEAYSWSDVSTLTLTFRNVGSKAVNVSEIFVNGVQLNFVPSSYGGGIPVGTTNSFTVTGLGSDWTPGTSYVVKVVTLDGGYFSFSVICGSAQ